MKKITKKKYENKNNISLFFNGDIIYTPGQFLMVWIPGFGEKPYTIAGMNNNEIMITIRIRGDFSKKLCNLPVSSLIGIRGPYGRGFSLVNDACIVAGGIGFAAVAPLINQISNSIILYGERTYGNIIYQNKFNNIKYYTEDGSFGKKGFPTDDLSSIIESNNIRMIYSCGPEKLLVKILDICNFYKIDCQLALERYMKCGMGICGQCVCSSKRVCVDGPVFHASEIKDIKDFGKRKLNASGTWEKI